MPKREATPPLDDEFKYYIVYNPYPLHANMVIVEERLAFARWIASCIGPNYLFAIFHKPSAANMVIIEVSKACPQYLEHNLLGGHRWRDFLKNPPSDVSDRISGIYYCALHTGREVQKYVHSKVEYLLLPFPGWRRLDVEDLWFKDFDPEASEFVVNPYPKSSFFDTPPETQADFRLCRPLPVSIFPRYKSAVNPAPVGSSKRTDTKFGGKKVAAVSTAALPSTPSSRATDNLSRTHAGSSTLWSDMMDELDYMQIEDAVTGTRSGISSPVDPLQHLGLPPGLLAPASSTSSDWGWETPVSECEIVTTPESGEGPMSSSVNIDNAIDVITFGDGDTDKNDEAILWAEQREPRKTDWDKIICPEHKIPCKPSICTVLAKLERERERKMLEATKQRGRGGSNRAGNRGRGGRGRSNWSRR